MTWHVCVGHNFFAVLRLLEPREEVGQGVLTKSVVSHLSFRLLLVNLPCQGLRLLLPNQPRFSFYANFPMMWIKFLCVNLNACLWVYIKFLFCVFQIVKQLWAYIRKNNLQDPSNKRKIICDDALRVVFETDCTDMFKMNKLLAKHIIPLGPNSMSTLYILLHIVCHDIFDFMYNISPAFMQRSQLKLNVWS